MPNLLSVSFTAAHDMDGQGHGTIVNVLSTQVPHADRYITAGAVGGDAFIGRWLVRHRPDAGHVVVVPTDRSRVDTWWLEPGIRSAALVKVVLMPAGTTYRDCNARLVAEGTMTFGFPAYPQDDPRSLRSGTWQTIRMSRKAGKLSQWHCVKPPFTGRIEKYPAEFLAGSESTP